MTSQPFPSTNRRWTSAHTLVTAATLLAAFLRIWRLGSLPPQAWYDEIWFALRARELIETGQLVAHYGISDTAGNAGLVYLTAVSRIFGIDSIAGARAVAALAGVITIPLAYACLREVLRIEFGSKRHILAALAASILSYLAFVVILGRVGIEPALALPAALFSLWQVMLGLRRGKIGHWVLAGLVAGLAQYNGPHARFILPVLAWAIAEGISASRTTRQDWRGRTVLIAVGIAVCIPLISAFSQHPDWFYGRAEAVSAGVSLPENMLRVVGAFNVAGDINARQNMPGQPMLDGVLGIGFVVGILWALLHIRRSATARLLLFWLVVMALPAALTAEAPNFGRMIGVAPPAAALAVIGWDRVAGWLMARPWPILSPQVRADLRAAAAGLALLSLGLNIEVVFWRWAASADLAEAFTTASVQTARGLAARSANGEIVYVDQLAEVLDEPAFGYTFAGTDIRRVDLRQCVPMLPDPAAQADYLLTPEDDGNAPSLLGVYKQLDWKKVDINWGREVRLGLAGGGLDVSSPKAYAAPGISLIGSRIGPAGARGPGQEVRVRLFWQIETKIEVDLAAFVHLYKSDATTTEPVMSIERPPCGDVYPSTAWHPGEVIAFAAIFELPADITPGDYVVAVGWADAQTRVRSLIISADESLPDNQAVIGHVTVGSQ